MGQMIKMFTDGSFIEYDRGNFDNWCVYYTSSDGKKSPPKDVEYFELLKELAKKYGVNQIYDDYVKVYEWTGKKVDQRILRDITELSLEYGEDSLTVDIIFSILYLAMIAEENKRYTRLGKRIKRLGIYVLLHENKSVNYAANYMRNKGWLEISADCEKRGF